MSSACFSYARSLSSCLLVSTASIFLRASTEASIIFYRSEPIARDVSSIAAPSRFGASYKSRSFAC